MGSTVESPSVEPVEFQVVRNFQGSKLKGVEGYEGRVFTRAAPAMRGYLTFPKGVEYAHGLDSVLVSPDEVWAVRQGLKGEDRANDVHLTRGMVVYFWSDGKWRKAVYDVADEKNLILTRAEEGAEFHRTQNKWPQEVAGLKSVIDYAEGKGRIADVPESNVIALSTEEDNKGESPYNTNDTVRMVLPTMARPSGQFLHRAGRSSINVYDLTQRDLEERLRIQKGEEAEIRAVRLGYVDFVDIDVSSQLDYSGGVARGALLVDAKKSPQEITKCPRQVLLMPLTTHMFNMDSFNNTIDQSKR